MTVLIPIRWLVELVLVSWHWLFSHIGMNPDAGLTWVLSVVGVVAVARAALIPVFVRQIKNQRRMLEVAPELKKIQDKYKGKRDQFSRQEMSRETMDLYKRTGTNPLSSCLPMIVQMPIFFSLFAVLSNAQNGKVGVGLLNATLSHSFGNASLFNIAPLHDSFQSAMGKGNVAVMVTAGIMVAAMVASQFFTQRQILSKNISPEAKANPQFKMQQNMMYVLPLVMLWSGFAFPLGVMFYWLTTNIWTMVQQFIVIRNMPTPGTEAAKAREERLARRHKGVVPATAGADVVVLEAVEPKKITTQRQQPMSKNRAKNKKPGGKR